MLAQLDRDHLGQSNRHGISQLPHILRPATAEEIVVGEGLQSGAFTDGEVANPPVRVCQHVFSTWNSVVSRLQRLGGLVQGTARMPRVNTRSGVVLMVRHGSDWSLPFRGGQVGNAIAYCLPGLFPRHRMLNA